MKKVLKTYKAFFPVAYTWVFVVIAPLAVATLGCVNAIAMDALPAEFRQGLLPLLAVVLCMVVDAFGDWFTFNGMYGKDASFGIMLSSHEGSGCIKRAIQIDQVRRGLLFTVVTLIETIVEKISDHYVLQTGAKISAEEVIFRVFLVLFGYVISEAVLNGTRYISMMSVYFAVSYLAVGAASGIVTYIWMIAYVYGSFPLWPFLILFAILAVVVTVLSEKHVLKRFDKQLHGGKES